MFGSVSEKNTSGALLQIQKHKNKGRKKYGG